MGVRLYTPILGRFLTTDPIKGGNANAYSYPTDPINGFDLDGRWGWKKHFKKWGKALWKHKEAIAGAVALFACTVCTIVAASLAAVSAVRAYRAARSGDWAAFGGQALGVVTFGAGAYAGKAARLAAGRARQARSLGWSHKSLRSRMLFRASRDSASARRWRRAQAGIAAYDAGGFFYDHRHGAD